MRLRPEKRRTQLKARPKADLAFIETASIRPRKLLYDTTVYIDILQNRFPRTVSRCFALQKPGILRSPKQS